jgi:EAL domain-containing protein (putative c-di-GMP-specific phosphodiesterase class I)/CheY-like chemotaxis protein
MAGTTGPHGRAISVVVADYEPHVLEYLQTVLHLEGFDVAGAAATADEALQLVQHLHPDVALLDLNMPGGGVESVRLVGSLCPDTRIVIFSSEADGPVILPLLRNGIDGYVLKGTNPDHLVEALRSAVRGDPYLAPAVSRVAVGALADRLNEERQRTLQLERQRTRIVDTIAESRFVVTHQPIVDLASGAPAAVEALTRFTGPPARPPDVWFAEADRLGMRVPLELATASAALHDLPRLAAGLRLAINVSPTTALSGRLGEVLLGAPLHRIIIELTEHSPVTDYGALNAALTPWRDRGAQLAVDDAGGGYSSFAHILSMQPDLIKLDVSLTRDIHIDRPREALARALVGFALEMGVGVIAEGIETAAELATIASLGTPFGQGFHLGRPRPLDEQPTLLATDSIDLTAELGAHPRTSWLRTHRS